MTTPQQTLTEEIKAGTSLFSVNTCEVLHYQDLF